MGQGFPPKLMICELRQECAELVRAPYVDCDRKGIRGIMAVPESSPCQTSFVEPYKGGRNRSNPLQFRSVSTPISWRGCNLHCEPRGRVRIIHLRNPRQRKTVNDLLENSSNE